MRPARILLGKAEPSGRDARVHLRALRSRVPHLCLGLPSRNDRWLPCLGLPSRNDRCPPRRPSHFQSYMSQYAVAGHTLLNLAIGDALARAGEHAADPLRAWGGAATMLATGGATWCALALKAPSRAPCRSCPFPWRPSQRWPHSAAADVPRGGAGSGARSRGGIWQAARTPRSPAPPRPPRSRPRGAPKSAVRDLRRA